MTNTNMHYSDVSRTNNMNLVSTRPNEHTVLMEMGSLIASEYDLSGLHETRTIQPIGRSNAPYYSVLGSYLPCLPDADKATLFIARNAARIETYTQKHQQLGQSPDTNFMPFAIDTEKFISENRVDLLALAGNSPNYKVSGGVMQSMMGTVKEFNKALIALKNERTFNAIKDSDAYDLEIYKGVKSFKDRKIDLRVNDYNGKSKVSDFTLNDWFEIVQKKRNSSANVSDEDAHVFLHWETYNNLYLDIETVDLTAGSELNHPLHVHGLNVLRDKGSLEIFRGDFFVYKGITFHSVKNQFIKAEIPLGTYGGYAREIGHMDIPARLLVDYKVEDKYDKNWRANSEMAVIRFGELGGEQNDIIYTNNPHGITGNGNSSSAKVVSHMELNKRVFGYEIRASFGVKMIQAEKHVVIIGDPTDELNETINPLP